MVTIVVDYDNHAVRIEPGTGREIATIKLAAKMDEIKTLLTEILNAIAESSSIVIALDMQSEGEITNIEYY